MPVHYLFDAVLVVAVLGVMCYRQTTWRPVEVSQMWRMPIILGIVGLVMVSQTSGRVGTLDVALIAIELVVSLAIGAWMGAIAHFRRLPEPVAFGKDDRYLAEYESRTSAWGSALWLLMIATRIGLAVVAHLTGAQLAASTGLILLAFAANRAGRTFVFAGRLTRHAASPMPQLHDTLRS
ncbi:hypothetical protein HH308_04805 [Gordonia sp. TBRC 11910]|uniref:DUF1453 domain-containing protein n=1 Tax=Gordonia asplenii TaxID=2725283 RepID=A0A848KVQ8_9ACTN|nr:hypothetical protein [Gordonia asplenii]NMO00533.1 hypothetical protein [Gordonia asplenii]